MDADALSLVAEGSHIPFVAAAVLLTVGLLYSWVAPELVAGGRATEVAECSTLFYCNIKLI